MAIYGVVMGQAVSKAVLGTDKLTTGYKEGQFLYSCSAIILVNAAAGSAGLYHFPAGDIYKDDDSRAVIQEMIKDGGSVQAVWGNLLVLAGYGCVLLLLASRTLQDVE